MSSKRESSSLFISFILFLLYHIIISIIYIYIHISIKRKKDTNREKRRYKYIYIYYSYIHTIRVIVYLVVAISPSFAIRSFCPIFLSWIPRLKLLLPLEMYLSVSSPFNVK